MIHAVTRLARRAIALLAFGLLPVPAPAQPAPTDAWLDQTRARWAAVAQKIWETPELALEEKKSSAALAAELEKEGFRVTWGSGGEATAFVATSGSGKPIVALLAEYDALPGLSQAAGKPKKEALVENGPGHGCGHNLLGTAAVAAAIAANRARVEQKLPGTIQLFGTPAEEQLYGKTFMIRDGAFRDTDVVLSWHPDDQNRISNRTRLAATAVDVEFFGRSSHAAASPWLGRSSLDALVLFDHAMSLMREHIKPTARIHRVISKGGAAANIIPDYAKGQYYRERNGGTASSDIAEVSAVAPLAELNIAARPLGTAAHHWAETACAAHPIGHKAMMVAAKVLAASAVDLLKDPALVTAARDDLQKETKGKPYVSPLAPDARPRPY
jgi:metal-dependent amidase/aminoacylase/carboxypeptidase family protein